MAAPTPSTGFAISGITTVKWGTRGMSGVCTVIDISQAADVEQINIENGDGIPATRILLTKGVRWNLTIVDDTRLTPPNIGDAITLVNILKDGTMYAFKGVIVENSAQTARKQEQHRVLTVENLVLIDAITGAQTPDL